LKRRVLKVILAGSLFALGLIGLARMAEALPVTFLGQSLEQTAHRFFEQGLISAPSSVGLILARAGLETFVGLLLLIAAILMITRREFLAVTLGYIGLLLALVAVNFLVFYFDQFSAILIASAQFFVMVGLQYYRERFLEE
jgi:hypothetical protein